MLDGGQHGGTGLGVDAGTPGQATAAQPKNEKGLWPWVERASWSATLGGLVVAIVGLLLIWIEQRRTRIELAKKPDVKIGFDRDLGKDTPAKKITIPTLDGKREISPVWQAGKTISDPINLVIRSVNKGDRTAHNLVWNYFLLAPSLGTPAAPIGIQRASDHIHVVTASPALHPSATHDDSILLQVPDDLKKFVVMVVITMNDYVSEEHFLTVLVKREEKLPSSANPA